MTLTVLTTGPLATVQDCGRPGLARLGVSPSGPADRAALALGNRLVGNPVDAAGIEVTLGGLSLRANAPCVLALTGAATAARIDGRPVGMNATVTLGAGATLSLGIPRHGLRTYLSVRGGIDVPSVLGSRSFDILSGLGPPPLAAGDALPISRSPLPIPDTDWALPSPRPSVLTVRPGPRMEWFTAFAVAALAGPAGWLVTDDADRVGLRLSGAVLPRVAERSSSELPSEGLVRGSVQVPPSGQPLIFLADHPTTGGYPVIAVIDDADTDALGQLRPGDSVHLRWA